MSEKKARIIDISVYQYEVDWAYLARLREKDLIHGVIIRQGQGDWEDEKFAAHVQGAYDAGIPALAYHVHEPRIYTATGVLDEDRWWKIADDPQMVRIRKSLQFKRIYGLATDVEVTWRWLTGNLERSLSSARFIRRTGTPTVTARRPKYGYINMICGGQSISSRRG
jgi:hypothetical protein